MSDAAQDKRTRVPTGPALVLAGAALIAVGSLMPWATASSPFGTISIPGTQGDGVATLIIAVLIALGAWWLWRHPGTQPWVRVVIALLAALVIVTGWQDMANMSERIETSESQSELLVGSIGAGLYVLLLGGVTALVGVFIVPRGVGASGPDKLQQDPQRGGDLAS